MNRIVSPPLSLAAGLLAWYGLPASTLEARADESLATPDAILKNEQPAPAPSITVETLQPEVPAARALPPVQPAPAVPNTLPQQPQRPVVKLDAAVAQPSLTVPDVPPPSQVPGNVALPPTTGKNSYIDPSPQGSFAPPKLPPLLPPASVELTERSTGCQTTVVNGQLVGATCQAPQAPQSPGLAAPPPPPLGVQSPIAAGDLPTVAVNGLPGASGVPQPQWVAGATPLPGLPPNLPKPKPAPPPRLNPANYVASALNTATSAIARRAPKLKLPGNGDRAILYPLANPGRISSLFGWRTHPIFGNRRFHSGTDIAAPHGTPVVAAYSGRVETAGYLSGYGLTVILRHADDTQESRYAHLSEIFVRPGTWVAQGTEIGSVGSTGNSTGPHLHFEWRQRQGSEWVAVDAGDRLQAGAQGHPDRGVVSLQPYRNGGDRGGVGEPGAVAVNGGIRAGWYVLPTVPPMGRLSTRPLTLSLWTRTGERATTPSSLSSSFWPLPPAFMTLLRWQPLQVLPKDRASSGLPVFLADRRDPFYQGIREFIPATDESSSESER